MKKLKVKKKSARKKGVKNADKKVKLKWEYNPQEKWGINE